MKEKLYVQPLGSEGYAVMRDAERIKACLDAFSGLTTEQILDGKWLKGGM